MFKDNSLQWYALYTKSRHEKFVEEQLLKKGIEAFTPKMTLRKFWSDRRKLIQEPLFKSYCFARFSLYDKMPTISQAGVVGVVHFREQYVSVKESVINSLKILTESKININSYPYINISDRVIVRKGPLKGIEGMIIEKRKNDSSLVIAVDAIACAVKCIVDIDCIDAA